MEPKKEKQRSLESCTEKEKWDGMNTAKRLQYVWDYYKLPIAIALVILYVMGYSIYRRASYKDTCLYAALVNVSIGSELEGQITDGFLEDQEIDPSKNQFLLYSGWYLTDDPASEYHEYTYATRMKILAAIDSEKLDVVFMNKEAFDAFAQNGYLCNMEVLLQETDPALYETLQDIIVTNMEILEDNAQDVVLDPSLEYVAETTEYPMAVDLSTAGRIQAAGFEDSIYFGVLGNTPRKETSVAYLNYLFSE